MWRVTNIWFLALGKSNIWINSLLTFHPIQTQAESDPVGELISIHFPDAFLASAIPALELGIIKLPNWSWAQSHPERDHIFHPSVKCELWLRVNNAWDLPITSLRTMSFRPDLLFSPPCKLEIAQDSNPASTRNEGGILGMVQKQTEKHLGWLIEQSHPTNPNYFPWEC